MIRAAVTPRSRVACVSFYTPGWGESTRVVQGLSVCDAARRAVEAFQSEYWHGPRPAPETWLEVTVVGSGSKPYWVTVGKALMLGKAQLASSNTDGQLLHKDQSRLPANSK